MDIGCVRMTERHLHDDPPTAAQIEAATADIDAAIAEASAAVHADRARTLVGLAGSVTTVAGIALDLPAYDPGKIHHARITADQVHEVTQNLLSLTVAQRREIGVMHPGRADVIGAGALVLDRIISEPRLRRSHHQRARHPRRHSLVARRHLTAEERGPADACSSPLPDRRWRIKRPEAG